MEPPTISELGGAGAVTPSDVDPSVAVAPRVSPPASPKTKETPRHPLTTYLEKRETHMTSFEERCEREDEEDRLAGLQPITDEMLETLERYGVQPARIEAMRRTRDDQQHRHDNSIPLRDGREEIIL